MILDWTSAYRLEMAAPSFTGVAIHAGLVVLHSSNSPAFGRFRVMSGISSNQQFDDENGVTRTWKPMGFAFKRAPVSAELTASCEFWVPGGEGLVWEALRGMQKSERMNPIVCILYEYLDNDASGPVIEPEEYFIHSAAPQVDPETGEDQVYMQGQGHQLHNIPAGVYFTADKFPHLVLADEVR